MEEDTPLPGKPNKVLANLMGSFGMSLSIRVSEVGRNAQPSYAHLAITRHRLSWKEAEGGASGADPEGTGGRGDCRLTLCSWNSPCSFMVEGGVMWGPATTGRKGTKWKGRLPDFVRMCEIPFDNS